MDEQVLNNLIELYRAKGISFDSLLVNPIFANLPIEAKIKLIKNHADKLGSGVKFDKSDAMNLLKVVGAGAAVYGVYRAGSSIMRKLINVPDDSSREVINAAAKDAVLKVSPLAMAMVPTAGLLTSSITQAVSDYNRKHAVKKYLRAIQENKAPDNNAIKVLGLAHETMKGR